MRGRCRESEPAEAPPHRAEIRFSLGVCRPLPASGAREAAPSSNRSKCPRRQNTETAEHLDLALKLSIVLDNFTHHFNDVLMTDEENQ